jgi:uncharacterized membrane protein
MDNQTHWLAKNWLLVFSLVWGIFVSLPFLAPVFMHWGWTEAGNSIYRIYSSTCHQLPQRSFFIFGPKAMYSLAEIQAAFQPTDNPAILRQFIGSPEMGWKVGWSDRMFSMYTVILPATWIWIAFRKKLGALSIWGLLFFLVPMVLDGTTHVVSDIAGFGQGFRDNNVWLAAITNNSLPVSFYVGDALGSFNSWMRLLSGAFFAIGIVWFALSYIYEVVENR